MKDKIVVLAKPMILTDGSGKNPQEEWWGKYLRRGLRIGKDTLYQPIFSSLWPGLWLNKKTSVRELYWYEWIDYGIKIAQRRIRSFFSYMKLAFRSLV